MNREKQIEEMAELERLLRIRRMDIEKQGCDIWTLIKKTESEEQSIADYLIGHGYRKASDVAREIFAEIEQTARAAIILLKFEKDEKIRNIKTECYTDLIGYIAELKKKYIGKDNNVPANTEEEK